MRSQTVSGSAVTPSLLPSSRNCSNHLSNSDSVFFVPSLNDHSTMTSRALAVNSARSLVLHHDLACSPAYCSVLHSDGQSRRSTWFALQSIPSTELTASGATSMTCGGPSCIRAYRPHLVRVTNSVVGQQNSPWDLHLNPNPQFGGIVPNARAM